MLTGTLRRGNAGDASLHLVHATRVPLTYVARCAYSCTDSLIHHDLSGRELLDMVSIKSPDQMMSPERPPAIQALDLESP